MVQYMEDNMECRFLARDCI